MSHSSESSQKRHEIVMGDRGRLVLPADVRKELGLEKGSRIQVSTDDAGSLRLRPYTAIVRASVGMFADVEPRDVSMVDQMIAERRLEAEREEERYAEGK